MKPLTLEQARKIASKLDGSARGWSSPDYTDSINISGFFIVDEGDDGALVTINWERIDQFSDEVAARAIKEYSEKESELSQSENQATSELSNWACDEVHEEIGKVMAQVAQSKNQVNNMAAYSAASDQVYAREDVRYWLDNAAKANNT